MSFTLVTSLVLSMALTAPESTRVSGALNLNDTAVPLTHACALLYDNEDSRDGPPVLRLLFTDREIPVSELDKSQLFDLYSMAREGALQGVSVEFDPALSPREVIATIYHQPEDEYLSMPSLSKSGGDAGFEGLVVSEDRVSGRAFHEAFTSFSTDTESFSYDITFDVPIVKGAPLKEKLLGAAASKSPLAKVYLDFEAAMREGDLSAARKFATPTRMALMEEMKEHFGEEAFLQQVKEFIPETKVREKQIDRLVVREDRAILSAREEGGVMSIPLKKIDGQWLVD